MSEENKSAPPGAKAPKRVKDGRGRKAAYDHETLKLKYVRGNDTLEEIARQNGLSVDHVKHLSADHGWVQARREWRQALHRSVAELLAEFQAGSSAEEEAKIRRLGAVMLDVIGQLMSAGNLTPAKAKALTETLCRAAALLRTPANSDGNGGAGSFTLTLHGPNGPEVVPEDEEDSDDEAA
jgi:hypothetical protein